MGQKKKIIKDQIKVEDNVKAFLEPMPYQDEDAPGILEKEKDDRDNCNLCRWKMQVVWTGFCPSIKKSVDLKNPVYDCEKFRRFEGTYY